MAIFESRFEKKLKLDDTQPLHCVIETAQVVNGHTEYVLRCQRGILNQSQWKILHRYNDFANLHKCLSISGIKLPIPGKKFIGNMRPDFIAQRRQELQVFINAVLMNPILASSLPAKRFVDPDSYSQSFHDQALQNSLLCLRSEGLWTLGPTLGPIGWRLRKHYFKVTTKPPEKSGNKLLVKSGSQSHSKHFAASTSSTHNSGSLDTGLSHESSSELVLEWLEYGPDKFIDEKELGSIFKSLMGLQHPHIEPILYAAHNENGCLAVRKFHKHGTLKDLICMSTPKNPFLSKYGNPKGRKALSMKQVATYGFQILNTLIFLNSKGLPYGHLHSGNIVILEDCIKLLDIENFILGVPSFYRPFYVQHSKIHTMETVDVYCFGHVLFEMANGYPLQESVVRQISDCPELLKNLLESILSKEACRAGLPTLDQLAKHDFFKQHCDADAAAAEDNAKPYLKFSLNAKELIKQAQLKVENRLREEQKSVKNQKRIVRVQELMSFEEEKRKSRQKTKVEHRQSSSKHRQSSFQTSNGRPSVSSQTGLTTGLVPLNRTESVLHMDENQGTTRDHHVKHTPTVTSVERQSSSPNISSDDHNEPDRSALLESICKFNRGSLRKVRSND